MNKNVQKLPVRFKKYFWDCYFDDLSMDKNTKFIIERLLVYGNLNDIKWLRANSSREKFINIATKSRRLDKRTINFWKIYFNV